MSRSRIWRATCGPSNRQLWAMPGMLVVALTAIWLVGCAPQQGAWPRIEQEGVLRVGLDPTFPPFEIAEGEEVRGLDVDLAQALAAELGLEPQFVYFGYDGLYDALDTEQVDVLISAMVIVPGRMRDFAYSEPYFNAGEILVVPKGAEIAETADLAGKRLAVELGAQGHVQARELAKQLPDLQVKPYASADEALTAVAAGEAAAAVVDSVSGRLYLRDHEDAALQRLETPLTVEPYAMVVRIEDETLLAELNGALEAIDERGDLDTITARWLGP